jgi:hypothetical protein
LPHDGVVKAGASEQVGVTLAAEDREQILEGGAEALGVVVAELVNDLEKGAQGFGVAAGSNTFWMASVWMR